ncbi:MAG: ComEA family DNA-binding protein, partial [Gemmatimonadaceae bacterium]
MATSNERKALWFLALVALSGSGVRMCRTARPASEAEAVAALDRQLSRLDSVRDTPRDKQRQKRGSRSTKTPVSQQAKLAGPIDLDRADSATMESLPGIGPALATRIIANRDSGGPFGSLEALCDVRGIGPGLIRKLDSLVTFT